MGFKTGIIGLPNVGKSTLFNALTSTAVAQAENFPFCTIEPNVGDVAINDSRLNKLARLAGSKNIIPTKMTFVDIAGLVKGASKGEGLGNQFLANIRECDAIAHVVRCFDNDDITHVNGKIDPISDIQTIETELMLSDLESIEKRMKSLEKKRKSGESEYKQLMNILSQCRTSLESGQPIRLLKMEDSDRRAGDVLNLLTSKKVVYVCNVDETSASKGNTFSTLVEEFALTQGSASVIISAGIEEEISQLSDDNEVGLFLEELGLTETGLNKLIKVGYELLGLQTYFTVGPKETRAWTIKKETLAPQAAGVIHSDFEQGFIRAETISYSNFIEYGGEQKAREAGKLRSEGKNYKVQDGDILNFLFSK